MSLKGREREEPTQTADGNNTAKKNIQFQREREKRIKEVCVRQSSNVSYGQQQTLLNPPPRPWLTSGQTCSYYYVYVGQFWCPDCDWSAFNAILLNGSVKMVRFERWHAQISAQSGRGRSPVSGLSCPGLGLGLSACYAIHMLDIFMKLLAGRRHRPAIRGKKHMWSFSQKLSQTPFRHTHTHTEGGGGGEERERHK